MSFSPNARYRALVVEDKKKKTSQIRISYNSGEDIFEPTWKHLETFSNFQKCYFTSDAIAVLITKDRELMIVNPQALERKSLGN